MRQARGDLMKLYAPGAGYGPDTTLTDTELIVGREHYPTAEVSAVRAFIKPSRLLAAVYQVTVGDKVVNVSFTQKDLEAGNAIIEELDRIALRNRGGRTGEEVRERRREEDVCEALAGRCAADGLDDGMDPQLLRRHLAVVVNGLEPDEHPYVTFVALANYRDGRRNDGQFAFVATERALHSSQRRLFGLRPVTLPWETVTDIALEEGTERSVLTIKAPRDAMRLGLGSGEAVAAVAALHAAWRGTPLSPAPRDAVLYTKGAEPNPKATGSDVAVPSPPGDPYEEVKKAKELLDLGILTQEEFDRKKRQLLGL
jgi:hypothetical protein